MIRFFRILFAWVMADQGFGTSKNKQSASNGWSSIAKPFSTTSLQVDVTLFFSKFSNNYFVIYALSLLNSNV